MSNLKNVISYLKKHEFLAVTAICLVAIVIVVIGFSVVEIIALVTGSSVEDVDTEIVQSVENDDRLWQNEDTHGEPAVFQDQALKKAIAMAMGVEDSELTLEMLESVTGLQISNNPDIASWQDIGLMPNLESLTITDCGVVSIQPITELSELKVLNLSGNKISDISGLLVLDGLEELNVSDNPIAKIPNLSGMQNLTVLNLDNTSISDLNFMRGSAVSELHISYTNVTGVEILADCKKLECLYMYGYNSMDLTPLQQLPNFHSIYLSQGFDHSQVDFMAGKFMMADKYTRVYLVLKNRGIDVYG